MVLRSLPVSFFMCDDNYNNIAKAVEKFFIQIQDANINDGGRSAYSYISKLLLYKWIKLIIRFFYFVAMGRFLKKLVKICIDVQLR
ncbi:hypothetical protein AM232_10420 [Bacillus sp. FJAT-21352]|nr:hypothetical protein AM232_10420 [Bacillus sp. FJAT-21352]